MIPATETPGHTSNEARPGGKLLPSLGILLVTGGLVLLGWFAYLWFTPVPAPYQYQPTAKGGVDQFGDLELDAWPDLAISQYAVQVPGVDKSVGQLTLAQRGDASPVLINWESHTSELLIAIDQKPSELSALATAIAKYAPEDALILAWWDTSRQINLLSKRETLFTSHLNEPLIIFDAWQAQEASIRAYENDFWQDTGSDQERDKFRRFSEALLETPEQGVASLRRLIGSDQEAYLVVHVTDLYKIGLMHPDKFSVAYKNFPLTGNMHGLINHIKVHQKKHNYETYTLQSRSEKEIRAYFLGDSQSSQTLLAQMLPLTGQNPPVDLEVASLIYQHGGYWLYKIPAGSDATKGG